jgi:hypothetical protein
MNTELFEFEAASDAAALGRTDPRKGAGGGDSRGPGRAEGRQIRKGNFNH